MRIKIQLRFPASLILYAKPFLPFSLPSIPHASFAGTNLRMSLLLAPRKDDKRSFAVKSGKSDRWPPSVDFAFGRYRRLSDPTRARNAIPDATVRWFQSNDTT